MGSPIIKAGIANQAFFFEATATAPALIDEIFSDNYHALEIPIGAGDTILDLGANEGMFAIMMAKLFPKALVIALEPIGRTFYQLLRNINLNSADNIVALNVGVGGSFHSRSMIVSKIFSGGSTGVATYVPSDHNLVGAEIVPLDWVLQMKKSFALLKIDIEGMEYDALYNAKRLSRVKCLVGEFHTNKRLRDKGFNIDELKKFVGDRIPLYRVETCNMAE